MDSCVKETNKIQLNMENFNRDSGFTFSWAWYPVTNMLTHQEARPSTANT